MYNTGKHQNHIISGATVQVRNGDVNYALRKLKKILDRDDRQKDLAKNEFYEKPSIKRKRANDLAARRARSNSNDLHSVHRRANPTSSKWQKGRRERRRVLDAKAQFESLTR